MLLKLRQIIERKKGQKDKVISLLYSCKDEIRQLKKKLIFQNKLEQLFKKVAQETQRQLEWHISEIVTLALASTFDNPYIFKAEFVQRRGKTECDLFFERDGFRVDPVAEAGGGAVDVTAFALRVAYVVAGKAKMEEYIDF